MSNRRRADSLQFGAVVVGGDYQGLGIVRSLGRSGFPVCVVDDEPSIARYSRYATHAIRVPLLRVAGFVIVATALALNNLYVSRTFILRDYLAVLAKPRRLGMTKAMGVRSSSRDKKTAV